MSKLLSKTTNVLMGIIAGLASIVFGLVLLVFSILMVPAIVLKTIFVATKSFFRFFYLNVEAFQETLEYEEEAAIKVATPIAMAHRLFWLSLGVLITVWDNIGEAYERS